MLGLAFATYGADRDLPRGNGFIAVFVAAIVMGVRRPDLRDSFADRAEEVVEIVKLGVFAVFGSLLTLHGAVQRRLGGGRESSRGRSCSRGPSRSGSRSPGTG